MSQNTYESLPKTRKQEIAALQTTQSIIGFGLDIWQQYTEKFSDETKFAGVYFQVLDTFKRPQTFYIDERAMEILKDQELSFWHSLMKPDAAKDADGTYRNKEYLDLYQAMHLIETHE